MSQVGALRIMTKFNSHLITYVLYFENNQSSQSAARIHTLPSPKTSGAIADAISKHTYPSLNILI